MSGIERKLDVFYKGKKAGMLTRLPSGVYSFVPASDDFPFVERMVSLQRPSRELFGVFENILSQGMRIEALSDSRSLRNIPCFLSGKPTGKRHP